MNIFLKTTLVSVTTVIPNAALMSNSVYAYGNIQAPHKAEETKKTQFSQWRQETGNGTEIVPLSTSFPRELGGLYQVAQGRQRTPSMFLPDNQIFCLLPSEVADFATSNQSLQAPSSCLTQKDERIIAQQSDPNRDRFLQPRSEPLPKEPEKTEPILPTPTPSPIVPSLETEDSNIVIPVNKIKVIGSTIFSPEELKSITEPLEGRSVTLEELQETAKKITRLYLEKGYITSRAIVPKQEVQDGTVEIRVIEGSIAEIQIEGNTRVSDRYIRKRLELGTETPVRVERIEGRLQLLKASPLIDSIEANLQPAKGEGQSSLVVTVDQANPFVIGANLDNYETVSTGAERIGATLGHLNLTGNGDSFITSFNHSLDAASWSLDTNYTLPVNAKDGTLQLRTVIERNEIVGEDFEDLDIDGDSELYEISFRQPIVNSLRKEFALSLGFSFEENRNFVNGVRLSGTERTNVLKFGQDFTSRDIQGVWALRSQFNLGVDIFDATVSENEDEADGIFLSWIGQIQRLQRLSENNLLIFQGDLQFTPDNLLGSEKFTLGGIFSVRGYRQNARLGDNGVRFSIEDRITLARNSENTPTFQLAPFADLGVVWNNSADDPDDNFLAGVGLGVLWQPISGLNIRLDYAPPLVDLDDKGDNIQEDGFYFSISYRN
ncbi:MAG: ShlB/FhaC/HecB family hemolysin secretion/activation protein [Xenococcaceae cyanobacterium MO_188.B29]|nr:ShlB/FhaC/HecB family hemolysin secretion/activation protein [Xenococcaceae cyanobacterium MO_188.B29]